MRKKLIIAGAAGALTLAGLGVALPALADGSSTTTGTASEDRIRDALADLEQRITDRVNATGAFDGPPGGPGRPDDGDADD